MTTPTTITTGAAIFAVRTRVTPLDQNGYPFAGAGVIVSGSLVKASLTPTMETGDDIVVKGASGDIVAMAKHGDMVKYGTIQLEMAVPDPNLIAACAGGVVFSDTSTEITAPPDAPTDLTGYDVGAVPDGTYGYKYTLYSPYGETTPSPELVVVLGAPGAIVIVPTMGDDALTLGAKIYGRTPGQEQFIGYVQNFSGTTSAAIPIGTYSATVPFNVPVDGLTTPILAGQYFVVLADGNDPKVVWQATETVGIGATVVPAVALGGPTTTVAIAAAGVLTPVWVEQAPLVAPEGQPPASNMSGGPGLNIGYQEPALGPVANENGVSLEFWMKRYKLGQQATDWPYYRFVIPAVKYMHIMPKDVANANLQTQLEGQAFENDVWGSGAFGDWLFDSSKWAQFVVSGEDTLPDITVAPVPAPL